MPLTGLLMGATRFSFAVNLPDHTIITVCIVKAAARCVRRSRNAPARLVG
ncbi:hypothetical protein L841_3097 [Mycobacterium sp. MAC_080597_8934]|nr:hypothetical protein L841_3097 [Mycobacterium sp. MAC_080597_8934]